VSAFPVEPASYTSDPRTTVTILPPAAPAAPAQLTGQALDTTSVRWDWTPVVGASSYSLREFDDSFQAAIAAPATFYIKTVTGPNKDSKIGKIFAHNAQGTSPVRLAAGPVYSLASVPGALGFTAFVSSIAVTWSQNGNPTVGTVYELQASTSGAPGTFRPTVPLSTVTAT